MWYANLKTTNIKALVKEVKNNVLKKNKKHLLKDSTQPN